MLRSPVQLGVATLSAKSPDLSDGNTLNALAQRVSSTSSSLKALIVPSMFFITFGLLSQQQLVPWLISTSFVVLHSIYHRSFPDIRKSFDTPQSHHKLSF